jgi:hypothetical protein
VKLTIHHLEECVELYFYSPIRLHGLVLILKKHMDNFTFAFTFTSVDADRLSNYNLFVMTLHHGVSRGLLICVHNQKHFICLSMKQSNTLTPKFVDNAVISVLRHFL